MTDFLHHPFPEPPAPGEATEVAPGILWMRLPLPMQLDHVNVYALDDGAGWTVVDTGFATAKTRAIWEALIAGPLSAKPVTRVLVTHYHPDHIGLAGWMHDRGAELVTTRTSFLYARMLCLDVQPAHTPQSLQFYRRAGISSAVLAVRATERPFNFADVVAPLPPGFTRIAQGDTFHAAGRDWRVRIGDGHAPEHATLWADGIVLGGDQLLPGISANIGVYPTEPEADPLAEWLASCRGFVPHAKASDLILPGHKLPFTGLPHRLQQMVENHVSALDRLLDHLATPHTARQCFVPLFKRDIVGPAESMALVESVAHLNYLLQRGAVGRSLDADGAWQWLRT